MRLAGTREGEGGGHKVPAASYSGMTKDTCIEAKLGPWTSREQQAYQFDVIYLTCDVIITS